MRKQGDRADGVTPSHGIEHIGNQIDNTGGPVLAAAIALGTPALAEDASSTGLTRQELQKTTPLRIDILEVGGARFDYVMVLEPTSPFRTPATIRRSLLALADKAAVTDATAPLSAGSLQRLRDDEHCLWVRTW